MKNKLYRIVDDPSISNRWHLRAPVDSFGAEVDPRLFTHCSRYENLQNKLSVVLRRSGEPISFTLADFDVPVISRALQEVVAAITEAQIQWIDIDVKGFDDSYVILNTLACISCIDESQSEFMKWQELDRRPDKTGQYRMFSRIVVDPDRCSEVDIFRIEEWKIALVVSEKIKRALESVHRLGIRFEPVS